ncbi:O-unit flippase [Clostridium tertium]|uniref:lipopolysaccharide biosynthesis protein n=1 Tax=Clostridium tertium TaxID=1559 RepID=UPI00232BC84B|nr:O-unit flippase [Clostridium tertium]MDB1921709.1 O-unit flippase [Clostridium tertium]MDB1924912.1 O-unit flippase [Clostridium tertium]MDB1929551.1 O-unit flippase [Clostridium tertium]
MRVKKAAINVIITIITFVIGLLPNFIVRKVFLVNLGNELLGLSSLFSNIVGLLSIVELGIGSAIIFSLYKPFAEGDKVKVKGYLDYYFNFYKKIGFVILGLGFLILPFIKLFIKEEINIFQAQQYFILYLINTVMSYWFTYKICILNVAQEGYKVLIGTTASKVIIALLQILSLKHYPNYYVFLIIQIIINLIYYIIINWYIDKKYRWIKTTHGEITIDEKNSLSQNVKALFLHKIGGVVVFGTDNLLISSFINLVTVSKYNSYNMVINSAQSLISNALASITASVGNLLTEGDRENNYLVHKRLFFLNFWVVSFVTISLFNTIKQFIILWLGHSEVLDVFTVSIILINFYFTLMRLCVDIFKEGGGLYYQDRLAPMFEAVINLISSIILVNLIGLPGVFLGTLISNFTVLFWVKPRIVYKYIFNKSLKEYFIRYFKYVLLALVPLTATAFLTSNLKNINNIWAFILNCLINIVVINVIYLIIFRNSEEFKYYKSLVLETINKKFKNKV